MSTGITTIKSPLYRVGPAINFPEAILAEIDRLVVDVLDQNLCLRKGKNSGIKQFELDSKKSIGDVVYDLFRRWQIWSGLFREPPSFDELVDILVRKLARQFKGIIKPELGMDFHFHRFEEGFDYKVTGSFANPHYDTYRHDGFNPGREWSLVLNGGSGFGKTFFYHGKDEYKGVPNDISKRIIMGDSSLTRVVAEPGVWYLMKNMDREFAADDGDIPSGDYEATIHDWDLAPDFNGSDFDHRFFVRFHLKPGMEEKLMGNPLHSY